MSQKLVEQLAADSLRNADLRRLMLMCQTEAQIIYVVCVGAGDAFINRYWPILRRYVAQKRLNLLLCDQKPLEELAKEKVQQAKGGGEEQAANILSERYEELIRSVNGESDVRYLNVNNKSERRWYDHIRADIVFVLVPDEVHIRVAKEWLKRSTLILIEKPYNRDLQETVEFENDLRFMMNHIGGNVPVTWVCPFDHYLSKISEYTFKKEQHQLFTRIGTLIKVEFGILEAGPVEPWRAESLRAGMIYDLFSHVLAMLSVEIDLSTFRHDQVRQIKVAQHNPCPLGFNGDTFAYFDFDIKDYQGRLIKVNGAVGKGVGKRDEKFLTFIGEFGSIKFDLDPKGSKQILIKEDRSGMEQPIYKVGQGHEEFLTTLLIGKYIEEPIGGLSGNIAIDILRIMNRIREKIPTLTYKYEVGISKDNIANYATSLRFS